MKPDWGRQQEQLWALAFGHGQSAREKLATNAHWPIVRQELVLAFSQGSAPAIARAQTRAVALELWAYARQDLTWAAEAFVEALREHSLFPVGSDPVLSMASTFEQVGIAWEGLHVASAVLCATRLSLAFRMTPVSVAWCEPERDAEGRIRKDQSGAFDWALLCLRFAAWPSGLRVQQSPKARPRGSSQSLAASSRSLMLPPLVRNSLLEVLAKVESESERWESSWPTRLVELVNRPIDGRAPHQELQLSDWKQLQDEHQALTQRQGLEKALKIKPNSNSTDVQSPRRTHRRL